MAFKQQFLIGCDSPECKAEILTWAISKSEAEINISLHDWYVYYDGSMTTTEHGHKCPLHDPRRK